MVVVVGIIVNVVFGIRISGVGVIGAVIIRSRMKKKMMIVAFEIIIDVVFGRIVIVVVVNCEDSTLSGQPAVGIIIVGDEAKGPIIVGIRVLDTAVGTVIV